MRRSETAQKIRRLLEHAVESDEFTCNPEPSESRRSILLPVAEQLLDVGEVEVSVDPAVRYRIDQCASLFGRGLPLLDGIVDIRVETDARPLIHATHSTARWSGRLKRCGS